MIGLAEELARGLGLEARSNGDRLAVGGSSWLTLLVEYRADERFVWALRIRTSSWDFAGDRTDLHRHLAVLAAIVLRADLAYSTSLYDEPNDFSMVDGEIYQCDDIYAGASCTKCGWSEGGEI